MLPEKTVFGGGNIRTERGGPLVRPLRIRVGIGLALLLRLPEPQNTAFHTTPRQAG